ncbi:nickel-responsive transcriptional regulator NikR (plasmid) [Methylocystis rosea]|uniref:Nickel-responsive transcriptional regulator NikR n=1 Tax=Methylocystis rosea TaxID=173366 RepID=A0A3G8MAK0_9HYPH|nr:nickel-responsive transcriptional regulator NikR [Methylocystis rosea]
MSSERSGHLNHRLTISVDDQFIRALQAYMKARRYAGVSEAIRDLAWRAFMEVEIAVSEDEKCMAALAYAYDFKTRNLASRLSGLYAESELVVSVSKSQSSARKFVEVAILKGQRKDVEQFAKKILAERGVTDGQLSLFRI